MGAWARAIAAAVLVAGCAGRSIVADLHERMVEIVDSDDGQRVGAKVNLYCAPGVSLTVDGGRFFRNASQYSALRDVRSIDLGVLQSHFLMYEHASLDMFELRVGVACPLGFEAPPGARSCGSCAPAAARSAEAPASPFRAVLMGAHVEVDAVFLGGAWHDPVAVAASQWLTLGLLLEARRRLPCAAESRIVVTRESASSKFGAFSLGGASAWESGARCRQTVVVDANMRIMFLARALDFGGAAGGRVSVVCGEGAVHTLDAAAQSSFCPVYCEGGEGRVEFEAPLAPPAGAEGGAEVEWYAVPAYASGDDLEARMWVGSVTGRSLDALAGCRAGEEPAGLPWAAAAPPAGWAGVLAEAGGRLEACAAFSTEGAGGAETAADAEAFLALGRRYEACEDGVVEYASAALSGLGVGGILGAAHAPPDVAAHAERAARDGWLAAGNVVFEFCIPGEAVEGRKLAYSPTSPSALRHVGAGPPSGDACRGRALQTFYNRWSALLSMLDADGGGEEGNVLVVLPRDASGAVLRVSKAYSVCDGDASWMFPECGGASGPRELGVRMVQNITV